MALIQSANVTVMVSDLDAAINFYVDTLGFTLVNRFGEHWADIEGPGIAIGLHPTDKPIAAGTNLQIGLRVQNLAKSVAMLEEKGVEFQNQDEAQVRLASFQDPDGNTLYLVEPS